MHVSKYHIHMFSVFFAVALTINTFVNYMFLNRQSDNFGLVLILKASTIYFSGES